MMAFLLFLVVGALFLFKIIQGSPIANGVNLTLPAGSTDHGDPKLVCLPTRWYHILEFFAVNYLAHVATIKSGPGQTYLDGLRDAVLALFFHSLEFTEHARLSVAGRPLQAVP